MRLERGWHTQRDKPSRKRCWVLAWAMKKEGEQTVTEKTGWDRILQGGDTGAGCFIMGNMSQKLPLGPSSGILSFIFFKQYF